MKESLRLAPVKIDQIMIKDGVCIPTQDWLKHANLKVEHLLSREVSFDFEEGELHCFYIDREKRLQKIQIGSSQIEYLQQDFSINKSLKDRLPEVLHEETKERIMRDVLVSGI